MLEQLTQGFDVDGRLMPWGTTLDQCGSVDPSPDFSQQPDTRTYRCRSVDSIAALSVTATAPGSDRPVTQLCYELAARQKMKARDWLDLITASLGAPATVDHDELVQDDALSDSNSVILYASWDTDTVNVGLSVYGADRPVEYGNAAACLWISWRTELAARPYISDRCRRNDEVAAIAARAPKCRIFELAVDLHSKQHHHHREASLALSLPDILDTPASIAEKLNSRRFAFWYSAVDAQWAASTKWDTVIFATGNSVDVSHIEIRPAKGGGSSTLRIGSWEVWDCYGQKEIERAVNFLAAISGVKITKYESYDC